MSFHLSSVIQLTLIGMMYSIVTVYAFCVAPIPAVRYDFSGGLPMGLS